MKLRKHLKGKRLTAARQLGFDRIIDLQVYIYYIQLFNYLKALVTLDASAIFFVAFFQFPLDTRAR